MGSDEAAHRVTALVEQIRPILAGEAPEVQSAVLADLLATWVAGHVVLGDLEETNEHRIDMLSGVVGLTVKLIGLNAAMLGVDQLMDVKGGRQ